MAAWKSTPSGRASPSSRSISLAARRPASAWRHSQSCQKPSGSGCTSAGLRRLGLADIHLSDAGLQRLEEMTTLEILYLMENPITDAGLDHLRKLTRLKELGLGQTKITDAGLERLKNFKDLEI